MKRINAKGFQIKLDTWDEKYLLFFVDDVMHEINAKENENLLETICDFVGEIDFFEDRFNCSTESHYTRDWTEHCKIEDLEEYPEYIYDFILSNESRWEIVIED